LPEAWSRTRRPFRVISGIYPDSEAPRFELAKGLLKRALPYLKA